MRGCDRFYLKFHCLACQEQSIFMSFTKRKRKILRWLGERSSAITLHIAPTCCFAKSCLSGELRESGIELSMPTEGRFCAVLWYSGSGRLLASRIRLLAIANSHVCGEQSPRKRSHAWCARRRQSWVKSSAASRFLSITSAKRNSLDRWLTATSANFSVLFSSNTHACTINTSLRKTIPVP
jgi:hypothetical protein